MRGTGYVISEILIFLAIAGIIGFLLGWVVFRRGGTATPEKAKLDMRELKQAETRVKALEALMAKAERRADAAVAAASKAAALAPAAAAPGTPGEKPEKVRPKKGPDGGKPAVEKKAPEPAKAETPKEQPKKTPEPAKAETPKEQPKKTPEPAKAETPKEEPRESTGDEELDEYLSDADQRIQKLEQTLDRLRGKLDDLDE